MYDQYCSKIVCFFFKCSLYSWQFSPIFFPLQFIFLIRLSGLWSNGKLASCLAICGPIINHPNKSVQLDHLIQCPLCQTWSRSYKETSIDRRNVLYLENVSVKSFLRRFNCSKFHYCSELNTAHGRAYNLIRFSRHGSLTSGSFHVRVKTCHNLYSTVRIAGLSRIAQIRWNS